MNCTGLGTKLMQFFKANPDEELTYDDAVAKFGCTPRLLSATVYNLVRDQKLERVTVVRVKRQAAPAKVVSWPTAR
jgi:hypothetical protein